jgi:hypothetical protein
MKRMGLTMTLKPTLLALAGLLLCSACANQPKTATLITPAAQEFSSIRWDEAVAAQQSAKVYNNSLIMMR